MASSGQDLETVGLYIASSIVQAKNNAADISWISAWIPSPSVHLAPARRMLAPGGNLLQTKQKALLPWNERGTGWTAPPTLAEAVQFRERCTFTCRPRPVLAEMRDENHWQSHLPVAYDVNHSNPSDQPSRHSDCLSLFLCAHRPCHHAFTITYKPHSTKGIPPVLLDSLLILHNHPLTVRVRINTRPLYPQIPLLFVIPKLNLRTLLLLSFSFPFLHLAFPPTQ